jgi:hypothetical protein
MPEQKIHIEATAHESACKWIRDIVSHTPQQIIQAWHDDNESIQLVDSDGSVTLLDLKSAFMIRIQDDEVFQRRSRDVSTRR